MRRRFVSLLAITVAALAGACSSSDGRELPPPDPNSTTTSVSAPVVGQPSEGDGDVVEVFSLTSSAFLQGAVMPSLYTCAGANVSPPLAWASTPPAAELALVVRDRDADGFVHWIVTGIDPTVQGMGQGGLPEGAVEALTSAGTAGWYGPCPPAGSGMHAYDFVLHTLAAPLDLAPGLPAAEAAARVESASTGSATLTGVVSAAG